MGPFPIVQLTRSAGWEPQESQAGFAHLIVPNLKQLQEDGPVLHCQDVELLRLTMNKKKLIRYKVGWALQAQG